MSYPTSLDSFTTKADTTDDVLAADINAIQAAVVALETELGTLPKGAYADVKARLAALATPSTPLTPSSLHATWGDHFTGASLDAKWTRVTYTSGDETYQAGGGSFLQIAPRAGGPTTTSRPPASGRRSPWSASSSSSPPAAPTRSACSPPTRRATAAA
jgi:hypothetical protein